MSNKQELEALEVPSVLLSDERIITHESLQELEHEELQALREALKTSIIARNLIPECVEGKDVIEYLEASHEIVSFNLVYLCDYADGSDEALLYQIIELFVANNNGYVDDLSNFGESFRGVYTDFADYATELADGIGLLKGVDETLARYFDWDSWTNDLSHDYTELDLPSGDVAIFSNC